MVYQKLPMSIFIRIFVEKEFLRTLKGAVKMDLFHWLTGN